MLFMETKLIHLFSSLKISGRPVYRSFYEQFGVRNVIDKRKQPSEKKTSDQKPLDGKVDFEPEVFANEAEYWWSRDNPLIAFNHIRVPFIRNSIYSVGYQSNVTGGVPPSRLDGVKILDVGCGGGILSEALARVGADVTGIDISKRLIEVAIEHQKQDISISNNLSYKHSTIYEHEKQNGEKYNAVVVSEVIEHVSNKPKFLRSCLKTVRPGGSIIITCPNKTYLSNIFTVKLAEAVGIVPKGTHDYYKFITPSDLIAMLMALDCQVRSLQGILYNPITNKFSMSGVRTFMYAVHAQKRIGMKTSISA